MGQTNSAQTYSASASINCFLCLGGRFRLSGITRVTAGAIPEFRAARRASVPLSKIFFRFLIPTPAGSLADLEVEGNLQIDTPIRRGRRKRTTRQTVRLTKQR